jgi:hypothetical protein
VRVPYSYVFSGIVLSAIFSLYAHVLWTIELSVQFLTSDYLYGILKLLLQQYFRYILAVVDPQGITMESFFSI